jgi:hypothetical protein
MLVSAVNIKTSAGRELFGPRTAQLWWYASERMRAMAWISWLVTSSAASDQLGVWFLFSVLLFSV